jgi:hypothetical protein
MVSAKPHKKRFLELTQLLLAFIGTCSVVDSSIPHGANHRPGFAATVPLEAGSGDRRFADLARTERRRREALQRSSRRAAGTQTAIAHREGAVQAA